MLVFDENSGSLSTIYIVWLWLPGVNSSKCKIAYVNIHEFNIAISSV